MLYRKWYRLQQRTKIQFLFFLTDNRYGVYRSQVYCLKKFYIFTDKQISKKKKEKPRTE